MDILMILTSHDRLGDTGDKTGFWLDEFATPYYRFLDAGATVWVASPQGGAAPIDPNSLGEEAASEATRRFHADEAAQRAIADTRPLDDVEPTEFDALFYPGGHGPMWDLAEDPASIGLIRAMLDAGRPVAAVCHGPAVLRHIREADGSALVNGRNVTGFTNSEEAAVGLTDVVPFLLEDELTALGGRYTKGPDFSAHTVADGDLITGQNPASSAPAAERLLSVLLARAAG